MHATLNNLFKTEGGMTVKSLDPKLPQLMLRSPLMTSLDWNGKQDNPLTAAYEKIRI